jgi:chromosome segregation ATPase
MAPTPSRQTAETLASTIEMVRIVDQKDRKVQVRFRKVCDGLRSGIDHGSEDEIALYRPQLAEVGAQIDDGLNNVQGALRLLAQLRADQSIMETRFAQVEKLLKTVAAVRKRFSDQAMEARRLDRDVEQALATIRKSVLSAEADLGALQSQMKALMKTTAWVEAESAKHEKAARTAWEKKDQKALTAARKALIDLLPVRDDVAAMKPRIEAYRKAHPELDRERQAEVQAMVDDLERAGDTMARVDRSVRELVALGQVPKEEEAAAPQAQRLGHAEVDKIVTAFGLDAAKHAGLRARAMKIVNACPLAKWPKELAKLYGAKEAELKAKIGNLLKLPFVKPMALIDI